MAREQPVMFADADRSMKVILFPFLVLAACGLALSVGAHLTGLVGATTPGGKLVWGLHLGIFVVWIPAVIVSLRTTRYAVQKDFWRVALAGCPVWMRRALNVLIGYAVLNFAVFIVTSVGESAQPVGDAPPSVIRGFSGHWMVFYGTAFAVLYSRIHAPHLYRERRCPEGHQASALARFCSECGFDFSKSDASI